MNVERPILRSQRYKMNVERPVLRSGRRKMNVERPILRSWYQASSLSGGPLVAIVIVVVVIVIVRWFSGFKAWDTSNPPRSAGPCLQILPGFQAFFCYQILAS